MAGPPCSDSASELLLSKRHILQLIWFDAEIISVVMVQVSELFGTGGTIKGNNECRLALDIMRL